jgi:UDP-GlcNAc:undecaprenyl-phosphate GlcNAc-1-phosphate transferase
VKQLEPTIEDLSIAGTADPVSIIELLNAFAPSFFVAFIVTLLITPLVRKFAIVLGVVDQPGGRKIHTQPIAYLGGLAVFVGIMAGVFSAAFVEAPLDQYRPVPISVIFGLIVIFLTGVGDDMFGWDPRLKIAGQMMAAAALAFESVGVQVAAGALNPLLGAGDTQLFFFPGVDWVLSSHVYNIVGTALVAVMVLGGCNAANLIDGLDGLLSGVTGIALVGLTLIGMMLLPEAGGDSVEAPQSLAVARIVLAVVGLGAILGFLPHNFNPANIFLGDAGSLMLGYLVVSIILMLGDRGQTHVVLAGLMVFTLPILDTFMAIVRRRLSGKRMSDPDSDHIHHQLKRSLGGVKPAVFTLYAIATLFAALGVLLAWLDVATELRGRVVYAGALVIFCSIVTYAIKVARSRVLSQQAN